MYLVRVQIDSNLSMSRQTLQQLTKIAKLKKPTAEAKAAIAIAMCLEFGLAAMETYIEEVLEMSMSDKKVFMDYFFEARQLGISKLLK